MLGVFVLRPLRSCWKLKCGSTLRIAYGQLRRKKQENIAQFDKTGHVPLTRNLVWKSNILHESALCRFALKSMGEQVRKGRSAFHDAYKSTNTSVRIWTGGNCEEKLDSRASVGSCMLDGPS